MHYSRSPANLGFVLSYRVLAVDIDDKDCSDLSIATIWNHQVNQLVGYSLRWIACLMACWLPFQPLAASSCPCDCACEKSDSTCSDGQGNCEHDHDHDHPVCQTKTNIEPKRSARPFQPCECPPSCPCHERHPPPQVDQLRTQQTERAQQQIETSRHWFVPRNPSAKPANLAFQLPSIKVRRSALACCAVLCRFTI